MREAHGARLRYPPPSHAAVTFSTSATQPAASSRRRGVVGSASVVVALTVEVRRATRLSRTRASASWVASSSASTPRHRSCQTSRRASTASR
ncbi:Uncharacterised protein [Mycobacteroides abscessus]|nr:Uncharacterised protein [Mycobacteroides abscessus]